MNQVPYYQPLDSLNSWEGFLADRSASTRSNVSEAAPENATRALYLLNHRHQTYDFARGKAQDHLTAPRRLMSVWEALQQLDELTDLAAPGVSQQQHAFQTAEAIRADGHPDWLVLVGLIHDLGKILCTFGEPQWAVVGNSFPLGCRFAREVVCSEYFRLNPDEQNSAYQTPLGIYTAGCGLKNVQFSWGHGEYLYRLVRPYLPEAALYVIRYHSFFAAHRHGAYTYLMDAHDREMLPWLRMFAGYDTAAASPQPLNVNQVRPYYDQLVAKYLPQQLAL